MYIVRWAGPDSSLSIPDFHPAPAPAVTNEACGSGKAWLFRLPQVLRSDSNMERIPALFVSFFSSSLVLIRTSNSSRVSKLRFASLSGTRKPPQEDPELWSPSVYLSVHIEFTQKMGAQVLCKVLQERIGDCWLFWGYFRVLRKMVPCFFRNDPCLVLSAFVKFCCVFSPRQTTLACRLSVLRISNVRPGRA